MVLALVRFSSSNVPRLRALMATYNGQPTKAPLRDRLSHWKTVNTHVMHLYGIVRLTENRWWPQLDRTAVAILRALALTCSLLSETVV